MRPDPYPAPIDLRSLDEEPRAIRPPYDQHRPVAPGRDLAAVRGDYLAALTEPLTGLPLGAYDRRILTWLAGWDVPTIGAVASLLHRARAAAPLDGPHLAPGGAA